MKNIYPSQIKPEILRTMRTDSIEKGILALGGTVTKPELYSLIFSQLTTVKARTKEWRFYDVERMYVQDLLKLISFPIRTLSDSISKLLQERLQDPKLTFLEDRDHDYWTGLDITDFSDIRKIGMILRTILIRLNVNQKFLLGITYLRTLFGIGNCKR